MLELLQAVEATLKPLFESIGEGVLIVDPTGKPVLWNEAAERILGSDTFRVEEASWIDRAGVFGPDGVTPLSGFDRPLFRAMRGEVVTNQEFIIRGADGRIVQVSSTARALKDTTGAVQGGVAIFRDIGEQRRSQAELQASQRLYRTLTNHLPSTVVMMYDRNLLFTIAGGGGLAAAGFTPLQIEGKPVSEYASAELLPAYSAVFDGIGVEREVQRKDGRFYRVQLVPVRDEAETVFAGLMVAEDITDQRRRENERREVEQLKFLAEAIPQIVWTAEPDGALDYYSQAWFDYTGMTLEQTKGWGWAPVLHPDDLQECIRVWTEAVRTGSDYETHYRFKRAVDGQYRWHLGRARPVRDVKGKILKWFGTCTDIDDQRRAEEALRESKHALEARVRERTAELHALNAALEQSLREKEVLLKEIHHRVKNNLQVISSLLKLHSDQVTDPVALAAFQDSQDRVRAIALLHEQLYQSKNLGEVAVTPYAEALIQTLARASAQRPVRFNVDGGKITLPVDSAVPFGLILNELIMNCLKHAFLGEVVVDPRVEVILKRVGADLELVVSDNGRGLAANFDPSTMQSLGMHLVMALAGQLGGTIRFTTEGGAKCRLLFPDPAKGER